METTSSTGTNANIWIRRTNTLISLCSHLPVVGLFTLFSYERFSPLLYSHRKVAWQKWKKHPSPEADGKAVEIDFRSAGSKSTMAVSGLKSRSVARCEKPSW